MDRIGDIQSNSGESSLNPENSTVSLASLTISQVETDLERKSIWRMPFSRDIEAFYETETRSLRASHIRLTVVMGLISYHVFSFVDGTLLPDLGWMPILMRLLIITPAGFFALWMCSRAGPAFREAFLGIAMTVTLAIPIFFVYMSRATLSPYTIFVALLVCMFGNITIRLRFHWAIFFSSSTALGIGLLVWRRPDMPVGLAATIGMSMLICISFGLVANNQLERSERQSFLLNLRERLRLVQLNADKDSLSSLSMTDSLTGLANRRAFDTRFNDLWQQWAQNGSEFSLILLDIDFFKRFNDYYGHQNGDACLVQVSAILKNSLIRQHDNVTRYGGEEFAILLPNCNANEAERVAQRFCFAVKNAALEHRGREDSCHVVTISAGVACVSAGDAYHSQAQLFEAADRKLYEAKLAGRDRIAVAQR